MRCQGWKRGAVQCRRWTSGDQLTCSYHRNRGLIVTRMLTTAGVELHRLGPPTKGGHPGHPLYLPPDIELEVHRTAMPLVREEVAAASRALPPPALDRMHTPSVGPRGDGYTDPASTGGAA